MNDNRQYFLLVNLPNGENYKFSFDTLPISIGRSIECQVKIDHDSISREHAEITKDSRSKIFLIDLDSTNGTFIGSVSVQREELSDATEFYIGQVQCLLTIHYNKTLHTAMTNSTRNLSMHTKKVNQTKIKITPPIHEQEHRDTVAISIKPKRNMKSFMRKWTYMLDGKPQQAVPMSQLVKLSREGVITPTTQVIAQGNNSHWEDASNLEQLKRVWRTKTLSESAKINISQIAVNSAIPGVSSGPFGITTCRYPGAGVKLRAMATLLDIAILAQLFLLLFTILFHFKLPPFNFDGPMQDTISTICSYNFLVNNLKLLIPIFLISGAYFAYMDSSWRQGTFGKKIIGIEVCDLDGNRINFFHAIGRYLCRILSIATGIGILITGLTLKKQAFHDMITSTLVIKRSTLKRSHFIILLLFIILSTSISISLLFLSSQIPS